MTGGIGRLGLMTKLKCGSSGILLDAATDSRAWLWRPFTRATDRSRASRAKVRALAVASEARSPARLAPSRTAAAADLPFRPLLGSFRAANLLLVPGTCRKSRSLSAGPLVSQRPVCVPWPPQTVGSDRRVERDHASFPVSATYSRGTSLSRFTRWRSRLFRAGYRAGVWIRIRAGAWAENGPRTPRSRRPLASIPSI